MKCSLLRFDNDSILFKKICWNINWLYITCMVHCSALFFLLELLQGTLDMRNKTVADAYTPLHRVFMLDINEKMTQENMNKVTVYMN